MLMTTFSLHLLYGLQGCTRQVSFIWIKYRVKKVGKHREISNSYLHWKQFEDGKFFNANTEIQICMLVYFDLDCIYQFSLPLLFQTTIFVAISPVPTYEEATNTQKPPLAEETRTQDQQNGQTESNRSTWNIYSNNPRTHYSFWINGFIE